MGHQVKSNIPIQDDSADVLSFDVSTWKSGVYILHTTNKNGQKSTVRFVKE